MTHTNYIANAQRARQRASQAEHEYLMAMRTLNSPETDGARLDAARRLLDDSEQTLRSLQSLTW